MLLQLLLIRLVEVENLAVLFPNNSRPGRCTRLEILGPDFQPFQFTQKIADQIDQSGGFGDGGEVRQSPGGAGLVDQLADQAAFEEAAQRADGLGRVLKDRLGELIEGQHARGETADRRGVEQAAADVRCGPPCRRQPERLARAIFRQARAIAGEQRFSFSAAGRSGDDDQSCSHA